METVPVVCREKRKRVHSAKCPCCSHEQGKPELKARARQSRKRKSDKGKLGEPLLKTKRSSTSAKGKKVTKLLPPDSAICSSDVIQDETSATEVRVLRSGRSTPVWSDKSGDKEKPVPQRKKKLDIQKVGTDREQSKTSLSGFKPVPKKEPNCLNEKIVAVSKNKAKGEAKTKKHQSKVLNQKPRTSRVKIVNQTKGASKSPKQEIEVSPIKAKASLFAKRKGVNVTGLSTIAGSPKKTSAIEKLKLRAFDQLKEKLEIALKRNCISVPECVQLLQKITSLNLSKIFDCQSASGDESKSESLVAGLAGKSLPEIMTQGLQRSEADMKETEQLTMQTPAAAENLLNESAAQALVDFKPPTPSKSGSIVNAEASSSEQLDNLINVPKENFRFQDDLMNADIPLDNQFKTNVSNEVGGKVSYTTQTMRHSSTATAQQAADDILKSSIVMQSNLGQEIQRNTVHPAVVDPIRENNFADSSPGLVYPTSSPATVHQVRPTTNSLIPTANQVLQTTSFVSSTNTLIPTTNLASFPIAASNADAALIAISPGLSVVQPNVLITQPQVALQLVQPQQANLPINQNQSSPRLLCPNPAAVPLNTAPSNNQQQASLLTASLNQRLLLPNVPPPLDQRTLGSKLSPILPGIKQPIDRSNTGLTASTQDSVPATNTAEITSCKLRPILPREPLVSPTITVFNLPQQTLQQNVGNTGDISSHVKQVVKKFVNGRSRLPEKPSLQQTSLPIASTANKPVAANILRSKVKPNPAPSQSTQEYSELANKEQAIKALLSIGSGQRVVGQGTKETSDVVANKSSEGKDGDIVVVFDTDKGIFKVDDVTIDPQVNTIGKESYTCGKCGKIFTSLSYLARHIKRVCPDMTHRKWKCDHCEKAFRHPFGLQQHVFTHTGERPHKCTQCPKAFYSSNDLRRHSRIHSGERPYKCKHCVKTFATTISLKTHTFIHTGEKPHRCPHCTKTFATSSKLGRHIVTHSEKRPYACTQCPKTFNRSGDLRRHNLNLHEGKSPLVGGIEQKDNENTLENPEKLPTNVQIPTDYGNKG